MASNAKTPIPAGMHTVTPHLWFNGNCAEAVEYYQKAFGAEISGEVITGPGGDGVMHAMLLIGDSHLMMADAWPGSWEKGPETSASMGLWVYVEDCDALFERATGAGCEVLMPMNDAFWGDRFGKVKDPFGHCWSLATHKWEYTPEEIEQGMREWLASMEG